MASLKNLHKENETAISFLTRAIQVGGGQGRGGQGRAGEGRAGQGRAGVEGGRDPS